MTVDEVPGDGHPGAERAVGLAAHEERLQGPEDRPVPSPQGVVALGALMPMSAW